MADLTLMAVAANRVSCKRSAACTCCSPPCFGTLPPPVPRAQEPLCRQWRRTTPLELPNHFPDSLTSKPRPIVVP